MCFYSATTINPQVGAIYPLFGSAAPILYGDLTSFSIFMYVWHNRLCTLIYRFKGDMRFYSATTVNPQAGALYLLFGSAAPIHHGDLASLR